ncbi:MAG: hypothetical protein IPN29_09115 [Saprospiraceae bacterium]|nr:hypothetical protein [Saprospiraceae bacterium]
MSLKPTNINGLIALWALAECGIGGIMHAARLPFTGIFVGGVAIVCISLIAWYSQGNKNEIIRALSIVLAVKLIASPHSPWQAYVAVAFQGIIGMFILNALSRFAERVMLFSILCMLEAALQKILLSLLIYGLAFWSALDKAAQSLIQALHFDIQVSLVTFAFGFYTLLHLGAGLLLGRWIPRIPAELETITLPQDIDDPSIVGKNAPFRKSLPWIAGFVLLTSTTLALNFVLPAESRINLPLLLIRVILVTFGLTYVLGPFIKRLLPVLFPHARETDAQINSIVAGMPAFRIGFKKKMAWAKAHYSGIQVYKYLMLALLAESIYTHENRL